jgi:hypothetical protein
MGAGTSGSVATFFTSVLLNIKNNFTKVMFVEQVASACSLLRQPLLTLIESINIHYKGVDNFFGGGARGSER